MRVALIVPWLVKGGADRCGLDMIESIKHSYPDAEIDVVITRANQQGNAWADKFERHGRIVDLGPHWYHCNSSQALLDYVRESKPGWVIINNSHEAYSSLRSIRKALPFAHLSCLLHMELPGAWDFPAAIAKDHEHINTVFTVSDLLANKLHQRGVPKEKLYPLHWFGYKDVPEPAPIEDVRKALGIKDPDCKIILFPFRVSAQKRPQLIVPIMGYLTKRMNCVAVVAGCGNMEHVVRQQAKASGRVVKFLGAVNPSEMHHLYNAAFCCVTPSEDEGIPLVYYEAQQTGCPIVASDVGAVKELVVNGTGVLVPFEEDLKQQAMRYAGAVLGLNQQPQLRARIVSNAKANMKRFTYESWKHRFTQAMTRPVPCLSFSDSAHSPPIKEKVFVIGAPKTGTSSVGRALERLGFDDYRWNPVMQDYYHFSNLNPIWEHVGRFDSFSDGPFNTGDFYKVLFERYPDAKFIHTVRDKQKWKASFLDHFSENSENKFVPHRYRLHQIIPDEWWEWYDRRNAEIQHFFISRNAGHRLLRIEIGGNATPEQQWNRLCQFLGVAVPENNKDFPHVNKDPKDRVVPA